MTELTPDIRKIVAFEEETLVVGFKKADALRDSEVIVVLGAATSGRPHYRIGGRYRELKEMGHDLDNPASI